MEISELPEEFVKDYIHQFDGKPPFSAKMEKFGVISLGPNIFGIRRLMGETMDNRPIYEIESWHKRPEGWYLSKEKSNDVEALIQRMLNARQETDEEFRARAVAEYEFLKTLDERGVPIPQKEDEDELFD